MSKILALDLDETLLSSDKTISDDNINALGNLLDAGHYIAIDTGRPIHGIQKLLEPYDIFKNKNVFFLGYQGVVGYNACDGSRLFTDYIDSKKAASLIEAIVAENTTALAFDEKWIYTFEENSNVLKYNEITHEPVKYIKSTDELLDKKICKCMAVDFDSYDNLLSVEEKLTPVFGKDYNIMFSTPTFLEFVKTGASKGHGLYLLADRLGVDMANTVACGDERNDISMVVEAGVGVAVANAQEDVHAVADYITKMDNNHGAIAEVVYKYFL